MDKNANRDAAIALNHLEEFCKRGIAVDPIGPRKVIMDFIHQASSEISSLQGQLASAKALGTGACDAVIAACKEQTAALRDVAAERQRQMQVEGWTPEHDDEHDSGVLAAAASAYALYTADELNPQSQGDGDYGSACPPMWPFNIDWWKPEDPRRALVKAGALILAEIERLDRAEAAKVADPALVEAAMLQAGIDPAAELYTAADEARMDVIGQNGNDGAVYEALSPEPGNDGWIEWHGGLCPVADLDAMVWVQLEGDIPTKFGRPGTAGRWDWRAVPAMGRGRIVAYRLTDPDRPAS